MPEAQPSQVDIVLVHSSDLHVDDEHNAAKHTDGTAGLAAVLACARAAAADVVLLAGDTFDNNRVPAPVLDRTGRLLADAGVPVVILPGNHDPALPNSVFVRGGLASIPNVTIILNHPNRVTDSRLDRQEKTLATCAKTIAAKVTVVASLYKGEDQSNGVPQLQPFAKR